MTLVHRGRVLRALVALPLLSLPVSARASGFALETQGARAMGFADAFVAQKDDASAVAYNAAALGFLRYKQFSIGGHFATASTDTTGLGEYPPVGRLEKSAQGLGPLPAVYYAQPLGESFAFGLGFDAPFGWMSSWEQAGNSTVRFICTECEIRTWRVAPTLALRLADRLAVGGGADVLLSKFSLTRRMIANPNPFPEMTDVAETTVKTDTTVAVGWNLGLLASPTEKLSVGLAYHNRINVTHSAQASFDQILTGDEAVDAAVAEGLPEAQVAEVAFTYPGRVVGGVAWRGNRLTVEGDVTLTLWSTFDRVLLTYRNTDLDSFLPADFSNTWKVALGAEYLLRDEWAVRGGYSFETTPQPVSSLSPFYNDSRRHALSLGGGYIGEKVRLDAAIRVILRGSRQTDGANDYGYEAIYNQASSFAAGLSLGYRF